jgi:adenosylcobinamide-phosphate synthase
MNGPAFAAATVALAGVIDVALGEPPNVIHPVVWMGHLVEALKRGRPHGGPRAELAHGALIVIVTAGLAAGAGILIVIGLRHLPLWAALPIAALVLKTAFSLRGLVGAARHVQRALANDTVAARAGLAALVSRSRDLEPPQIVSAAVESLAENLSDSVVAPLFFFALFGLPGALAYRAVNTMDAMIGYRGEYEHLGKVAARLDDVLNWIPARLTGLLLVALAGARHTRGQAWACLRTRPHPPTGPNKLVTISAMSGALGVQLEKPGVYAVGPGGEPLTAPVIGEAIKLVWAVSGVTLVGAAGLAALVRWGVWG